MKTSVAICTYNGERFLNQQLDSILNQTHRVDEIVVCDDQSTDSTVSILNSYKEKYPKIFHIHINEKNLRSVKNFEKCISLCENDIIFLCDQDDIWVNDKVEKMLKAFEENKEISVICTNGFGIDEHNKTLDVLSLWDIPKHVRKNGYHFDYFIILNLIDNFCTGATMALRRDLKKDILPIPIIDNVHHDGWIAMVAALQNKLFFLDEKLIYYRKHPSQQVGNVFFENTKKSRRDLTNYFSIDKEKKSFKDYKRFLKRFSNAYQKNKALLEELPYQKEYFESNLLELKRRFDFYSAEMKENFPVKSQFLLIADMFLRKRKM
ncbi:glycosyltransferase family 2 protein [Chryseobacterium sp. KACC 21268]|nr:glycosyltransferase family 2 protein [Chryseobacterium sp. KACC 21268]